MTHLNIAFVTLALLAILAGCQASSISTGQRAGEASKPQESPLLPALNDSASRSDREDPDVNIGVSGELKKGMAYADLSARVQADGWIPSPDGQCKENVAGGSYQALCEKNPKLTSCHVCEDMPELSSCSGDGYCGMFFHSAKDAQILEVTTYGMIEDWKVMGTESRLNVVDWEVTK